MFFGGSGPRHDIGPKPPLPPLSHVMRTNKKTVSRCFRCLEVGSTRTNRQQTNTYTPSFQLSKALIPAAKARVPAKYAQLVSESGLVQIYVSAMKDLLPFFYQSRHLGIMYQEAKVKSVTSTMIDTTKFKKRNADGQVDNGAYAAAMAKLEDE